MDHDWDHVNEFCKSCGITKEDYVNSSEFHVIFCNPNQKAQTTTMQTEEQYIAPKRKIEVCTCGAWHTTKPNSHSNWCDIK